MDWQRWHDSYDRSDSPLARRLAVVQQQIAAALDRGPAGPLKVVSLCAGQGRDLLEVLPVHPRRADVRARLVELDAGNTARAREAVAAAGLEHVEVVTGDAALTGHYAGMVPADLVLICGLFGNITDGDVRRVIGFCPRLARTGATVIWTRHRSVPDLVPRICEWFGDHGFRQRWVSDPEVSHSVGVHDFTADPQPLAADQRMFTFVGYDKLHEARQRTS